MSLPNLNAIILKNGDYTHTFNDPYLSNIYAIYSPPLHGSASCQFNESIEQYVLIYIPFVDFTGTDSFLMERYEDLGSGVRGPSEYFEVTIITSDPPNITTGLPPTYTVYQVDSPTLAVTVESAAPLTYSWYINDELRQGPSSSAQFLIESAQYALGDYSLRVDVTNDLGIVSNSCTLVIQLRPLNLPLAIADPVGGIASGVGDGVLTVTGGNGGVGQWITTGAPAVELVDPCDGTLTVADMTTAYNTLMWSLKQAWALQTEPRIWFGQCGSADEEGGIVSVRPTSTTTILNPNPPPASIIITPIPRFYAPYPPGEPYTTVSISDVMTGLNGMFSYLSDKIRFTYADGRVTFAMSEGDVKFTNPSPISFGSGERLLARVFNRADLSNSPNPSNNIVFDQIYNAPMYIQGNPLTITETGMVEGYPIPYGVIPGTTSQQIGTTFINIFWQPSASAGVIRYYVYVRTMDDSFVSCNVTSGSSYSCGNLEPNTQYKIQVIASTAFEISQNNFVEYATTKP